ncbi:MAG: hypothetical protein ACLFT6_08975 [Bacteroidales bacterium]
MKMINRKLIGLMVLMICLIAPMTYAATYESYFEEIYNKNINQEFTITAYYERNGELINESKAYINIINPENQEVVENESMENVGDGTYTYNYSSSRTGEYSVKAVFYEDDTQDNLLTETYTTFFIGGVDEITWGQCPATEQGNKNMWYMISILVFMGVVGIAIKSLGLSTVAGFLLIFSTLITWNCGELIGYMTIISGVVFIAIALNFKID